MRVIRGVGYPRVFHGFRRFHPYFIRLVKSGILRLIPVLASYSLGSLLYLFIEFIYKFVELFNKFFLIFRTTTFYFKCYFTIGYIIYSYHVGLAGIEPATF